MAGSSLDLHLADPAALLVPAAVPGLLEVVGRVAGRPGRMAERGGVKLRTFRHVFGARVAPAGKAALEIRDLFREVGGWRACHPPSGEPPVA